MKVTKKTPPKGKSLSDALVMLMPIVVPYAVKKLFALVPPGSKVDEFFEHYKEHWGTISTAVGTLILQITNMPDLADDLVAELSAEVARVIKEKYSDGEHLKSIAPLTATNGCPLSAVMSSLTLANLNKFTQLLNLLPEEQGKRIRAYSSDSKDEARSLIKLLVRMTDDQFKAWADVMEPAKKPRVDSEFEKAFKAGLNEFQTDAKAFLQKDSYFVRMAKSKGLM